MFACIGTFMNMFVQTHAFGGLGGGFGMHHEPVHVPDDCTLADWEFDPDGIPLINHFEHVAQTSLDLPLDSDQLFFISQGLGNLANGVIDITDSGEPGSDIVKVDVLAYYNSQFHFEELTKLCKLNPEDGKNGVGVFVSGCRGSAAWRTDSVVPRHRFVGLVIAITATGHNLGSQCESHHLPTDRKPLSRN